MNHLKDNLKYLRAKNKLTQTHLADALGLNRPMIGSYEEGRAEPKAEVLIQMSKYFGIATEALIEQDLSKKSSPEKVFELKIKVLPIIVAEKTGMEKIPLVPVKAAAGYLNGFGDTEFIEKLETFDLPFSEIKRDHTHRIFQIKGDSMLPIPEGAYVICKYADEWSSLKNNTCCVFVTENEGIVYKRVINNMQKNQTFTLVSDNTHYQPFNVNIDDVKEVWPAVGYVSFDIP